MTSALKAILHESSSRHRHRCLCRVLGARMSIFACGLLGLDLPRADKRLLVTAETDGCTVDGLIAATGCHVGGRTLRILDFGKVAATFTDTASGASLRLIPHREARRLAAEYAPSAINHWQAMLLGYQVMPAEELFTVQWVELSTPLSQTLSRAGVKAVCEECGEEIINGREVSRGNTTLCRACAGDRYFHVLSGELLNPESRPA
jgi:formylmethanofuran dehydrogenase subunit E